MAPGALLVDQHSGAGLLPLDGRSEHTIVYEYVRNTHSFLTDANHWVRFPREEKSVGFQRTIHIHKPYDASFIWDSHWFSQRWWIVTPEIIDGQMAENDATRLQRIAEAEACRDSVRGRRRRKELNSIVKEYERLNRVLTRRREHIERDLFWPTVEGLK